jgi:hypothetical protein
MSNVTTKELWKATAPVVEQHPADNDYAPPAASVKLPSRGLVYPPESPLYRCESIDIKHVTAKEENILSSPILVKKGIVLSELMKACITNRTIDPDTMLVGDRNAVLVSIRVSAYGPKYGAMVTCPDCDEQVDHDFDVGRVGLKTLDVEPVAGPGTNEFLFKLPVSGREVHFKLMDATSINQLEKDLDAIKKKTGQEEGVTMRLHAQITKLQGVDQKDRSKMKRAIESLSAQDARALRIYMDKIAPGVDMTQAFECPSCGKTNEVEIPIGTGFFWPSEGR